MNQRKVLVITHKSEYAVGNLFVKALISIGHDVRTFDLVDVLSRYVRGGKIGIKINTFWPVDAWHRKANRELAILIQEFKPDYLLISGDNPVQLGTLAFARSILPGLKIILFWPDTLVNLTMAIANLHPMIDVVASYSNVAMDQFKAIGFKECVWMPFAGDSDFLAKESDNDAEGNFQYDCGFVGGGRPERELVLGRIVQAIPNVSLKIVGPDWSKRVENKNLVRFISNSAKYGREFGKLIRSTRINLNIIDDTNWPAANMRFFELPAAGGLQLSSACPEQDQEFIDGKHVFYYGTPDDAVDKIKYILSHEDLAYQVRKAGYEFVRDHHTYKHRMKLIVK